MITAIAISVLLLMFLFNFIRRKQKQQCFNRAVDMTVNYMFQERPGQYSGDRTSKSGVFVFKAERNDDQLKNIVIRKVRPLHAALNVNLEQILVIPFGQKEVSRADVSVRFKVIKKRVLVENLTGERVSISGVLNFEQGRQEPFTTVVSISNLYQKVEI
ncbi:hypothetical protein [Sphingobacterium prati]|uniref:hypothetical protein n=1 Tax=Sphingobacterium prati TaxID=2737006 RepID=UPI00155437BB|nr:hypothetical protein [Sphingobacterium prati]NPE45866.1 hypothetical protein [Sphingobacterium prati]